MKRTFKIFILVALHIFFFSFIAFAHSVILWAYVEKGTVYVEAFTQDGIKIKSAKLVVVDKAGKILLEGKTDAEGKFNFDSMLKDEITIVIIIDDAHKAEFTLKAEDFMGQ
jgi:nickel transport protein